MGPDYFGSLTSSRWTQMSQFHEIAASCKRLHLSRSASDIVELLVRYYIAPHARVELKNVPDQ